MVAPATWVHDEQELSEPDGLVIVTVHSAPATDPAKLIASWLAVDAPAIAKTRGFEKVEPATAPTITMPKGWEGGELIASFGDPMGYQQRYRMIACGKVIDGMLVLVVITTPETIAQAAPGFLQKLLSSVKRA